MRKVILAGVLLALVCVGIMGCEKGGTAPQGEEIPTAVQFKDGTEKYFLYQHKCPVCGGEPISADYFADTQKGRVYFDKQECLDEFNANKEEVLKKLEKQIDETMGGGME